MNLILKVNFKGKIIFKHKNSCKADWRQKHMNLIYNLIYYFCLNLKYNKFNPLCELYLGRGVALW